MFFSDLVKQINIPIEIDFIRCKSYLGRKQGDLVVTKDFPDDPGNEKIIINWVKNFLLQRKTDFLCVRGDTLECQDRLQI